jgi:N,N-dimethylformamidase beta subunit-like protein/uncharacterized protein DUF4082/Big-like domain-containing protein
MDKKRFSRRGFLKRGMALTGGSVALGAVGTASAVTPNSIVTENQLPGAAQSQWDLGGTQGTGEGQYSGFGLGQSGVTNYIEGFTDNISVNRGQTINFKINTDCKNYRIDIYRLGYYAGLGARSVATLSMSTASVQPTPLTNAALGLIDAGNWSVTASWAVPATAVSGVYIAHLVRQDAVFGENHVTFVVRDDGTQHDIVFQTSDLTWHAYNGWGGPSLYGGASTPDNRAYKVSYNRPFATRDSIGLYAGPQDFLFGVEVSAIRWLEANGFDVSYISGVDTDRNGSQLLNHKIFLSVGHDEYWSGNQRTSVEAARAAGVHLAFLSGNEMFWKTRWEPSTDPSATPYRTLVCYKETRDSKPIDPNDPPTWTGSWRDPRFSPPADGGRPENALIGQIWAVDSWRADTITIPFPMTLLRFWRNTNVAKTASGQTVSLVPNLLGYEWDESPDNGFRPAGLIHLSSTTLAVSQYMVDYGLTDGAYTATHNLSLYRYAASGSIVFGAGTVFWSWGLDADHDLQLTGPETDDNALDTGANTNAPTTTPVDPNVQQAMLNLFADMGVQPQTLQSGLVAATKSTDTTPPSSNFSPLGTVTQQQTVTISGTATDTGGLVAGVEVSTDGGATWHPASGTTTWTYNWWPQAPGTFRILSRAVDDSLNLEVPGPGISVTVIPGTSVSLFNPGATSPYGGANAPALAGPSMPPDPGAVELGIQFQTAAAGTVTGIRFYKNPWNTGTHVGNLWSATGTLLGSATFKNETAFGWQQVNLTSPVTINPGTTYIVSYHSSAGNYSADSNFFATARTSGALLAPPTGGNSVYAYGATSVFPANSGGQANYWADVVFARAGGSGNQSPTANNDGGFSATENTPLVIPASALLANDLDPNGYALSITGVSNPTNGTVSYNADSQTVTFVPTSGYPSPNYTGPASFSYTISNGNGGTSTALVSITVSVATSSLFSATSAPTTVTANDNSPLEIGMKFQSASAGKAIGVRFYKGPKNLGTHVGNLWSSGALLATVTFANESATGWQQAYFSAPVTLAAGATYVVSYHTSGFYSADANYFATAISSGPLTAPTSASSGGNGVYAYGSSSVYPANSFNATNYWVDVIFAPAGDLGNVPPVANADSGFVVAKNYPLTIPASALLANDSDPNLLTLSITGVSSPTGGTVVYSAGSRTVTFTPSPGYTGPASFTYAIANTQGGTASASVSLTVSSTSSLFGTTATPATVSVNDPSSVELGVQFQTATAGTVSGIRFYKSTQNTGTHTANLWSVTGTLLATATFVGETASGWQQVNFTSPVALAPGTIYVASYHTTTGFYSANGAYFASAAVNGPLTAPAGNNGLYAYGSASVLPTGTFNSTNYWVDVIFNQT